MLRRVRRPQALESLPLVEAIRNALCLDDSVAAVRQLVEDVLASTGCAEERLRAVVIDTDFEGTASITEAAHRLGISRRHVQRYRAEVVALIAARLVHLFGNTVIRKLEPKNVNPSDTFSDLAKLVEKDTPGAAATIYELLEAPGNGRRAQLLLLRAHLDTGRELTQNAFDEYPDLPIPLISSGVEYSREISGRPVDGSTIYANIRNRHENHFDNATRLEFERIAYLRARNRSHTIEMRATANSFRKLVRMDNMALTTALHMQAETHLRLGEVVPARQHIDQGERLTFICGDSRGFARFTVLRAEMALFEGLASDAEDLAFAASIALEGSRADSKRCRTLVSRIHFLSSGSWTPPPDAVAVEPCAWDRIAFDIEDGRHLALQAKFATAQELLLIAYQRASSLGYEGLAARAAASLNACAFGNGDQTAAKAWAAEANRYLLTTQDHLLAAHLFERAAVAATLENGADWIVDVVHRRLCIFVPQMLADGLVQANATRRLLEAVIGALLDPKSSIEDTLRPGFDSVKARDTAFADYIEHSCEALTGILGLLDIALGGRRVWARENERVEQIVGLLRTTITPGKERACAVG